MLNPLRFYKSSKAIPLLTDKTKIDALYKKYRLSVMLAITIGYGFAYPLRLAMSVVKKPLIDTGIFTAFDLGGIDAALLYAYAFGKLFNGFLADHANLKRFFATGVLISALLNLTMGTTPTIMLLWIVLWGLNGWFQGFGAPTGAVVLSNWFSKNERGRYYGIWSTAHSLGEGLTFFVSATLVVYFGWRASFWAPGVFCIFVALGIYFFMQDRPNSLGLPSVADWKNEKSGEVEKVEQKTWSAQLSILKMPAIWILGLASSTMYVTRYAINNWGMLYLQEAKGYSTIEAASLIGVNTFAGIIGCVAYGFISDKLFKAKRPPVTLIFGILEVLSLFIIFFSPPGNTLLLTAAFILYGFTLSGLLAALGGLFAIDIVPKKAAGAVMGFIGVFSYIGAGVQSQISGFLIEKGAIITDGVRIYDFTNTIIFWISGSILSMILAAVLWRVKASD